MAQAARGRMPSRSVPGSAAFRRGARARGAELLERLELPVVVDADALFGLRAALRPAPTVLTPHVGELARLLDRDAAWVDAHRLEAARLAAEQFGAVVLLKGADTIVQSPGAADPSSATPARRRSRPRAPATCSPAS